jgi:hypothetical protein
MLSRSILGRVPPCDVPIGDRAVLAARGGWVRNGTPQSSRFLWPCWKDILSNLTQYER